MVSGLDLIRKEKGADAEAAVLTFNLLTDSNGNKIGKTQGNPI